MKLTKSKLREIIREEIKSLTEGSQTKPEKGGYYLDDEGDLWKVTKIQGDKVHLKGVSVRGTTVFPTDFDGGKFGDWFEYKSDINF